MGKQGSSTLLRPLQADRNHPVLALGWDTGLRLGGDWMKGRDWGRTPRVFITDSGRGGFWGLLPRMARKRGRWREGPGSRAVGCVRGLGLASWFRRDYRRALPSRPGRRLPRLLPELAPGVLSEALAGNRARRYSPGSAGGEDAELGVPLAGVPA